MNDELNNSAGLAAREDAHPTVPAAEIKAARRELAEQVKGVVAAAQDLEQLALLQEVPFEKAFCLAPEEVRKRYTAQNARQIEWRREACIQLLARQCPAQDICEILKMNHRTVAAIAAQEGQKIGTISHKIADVLASSAMGLVALADTKKHNASFKDLMVGAGIQLTHSMAFKLGGAAGDDVEAVEVEQVNEKLVQARKFLEARQVKTGLNPEGAK